MPTYQIADGQKVQLTGRMAIVPAPTLRGDLSTPTDAPTPGVLGSTTRSLEAAEGAPPTLPMDAFVPAQPALEMRMAPPDTTPRVLGAPPEDAASEVAMVEFQPDPGEGAVYAMLHEIHTPDGVVYDFTLPQSGVRGAVLGPQDELIPDMLRFPVHRMAAGGTPPTADPDQVPRTLGIGETIAEAISVEAAKHVLHLVKAPVDTAIRQTAARFEGAPFVVTIDPDGALAAPLEGAEAWRARFTPGQEHTVLLFIHGFNSNIERSLPRSWMRVLAPRYDAVLGYNHPTYSQDPVQNALDLLAMVPDDVQLRVDVVAHSRGGLVGRALVELHDFTPRLQVERIITYGSPHAGTPLAQNERWDRLISIGFTAASWLSSLAGLGPVGTFLPRGLELMLRAGSQFLFDLPGVEAMDPASEFLQKLNAPNDLVQRVHYAAITSDFDPTGIEQAGFRTALTSMAAQSFLGTSNDLVVTTPSMSSIDLEASPLGEWVFKTRTDHFSYFNSREVWDFTSTFLAR